MRGYINANYIDRNTCKDLQQSILINGFKQLMKDPTRISNTASTLIDVFLVNNEKNIAKSLVMSLSLSNYDFLACVRKVNRQRFQHRPIRSEVEINPSTIRSY